MNDLIVLLIVLGIYVLTEVVYAQYSKIPRKRESRGFQDSQTQEPKELK